MKRTNSNMRDVAALAGVSLGSVSKVLNNSPECRVSRKVQERILQAAKELSYTPNANAKRLFSKRIGVIALVVPPPSPGETSVFTDLHLCRILGGIEDELSKRSCRLMLVFNRKEFGPGREFLELYNGRQIDGLIVWGAEADESYWQEAVEQKIPLVFISSTPDVLIGKCHSVLPDFRKVAHAITGLVLQAGHKRIIYIDSQSATPVRLEINRGIEEALSRHNLRRSDVFQEERKRKEHDFSARFVERYLSEDNQKSAIITLNHSIATDISTELKKHGVNDISIACFDTAFGEKSDIIARGLVDDWALGVRAVRNLFAVIETPGMDAAQELLSFEIIQGNSIKENKPS